MPYYAETGRSRPLITLLITKITYINLLLHFRYQKMLFRMDGRLYGIPTLFS
jgi:hypothetical protein